MIKLTRRAFSAIGSAAAVLPSAALAHHRPGHGTRLQADLVVDSLEWSHDGGMTWGNGSVLEGEAVTFRAVVRNAGTASSPTNKIIVTSFRVDGSETASSEHRGGLAAGTSVTMEALNLWFAGPAGQSSAAAVVDPQNAVAESVEGNNQRSAPIEIQPGTPAVVAQDDVASTEVDTPVIIDVLANDTFPEGMEGFVSAVQSPTDMGGVAVITPDQKFVEYTPPAEFEGEDSFTYEAIAA